MSTYMFIGLLSRHLRQTLHSKHLLSAGAIPDAVTDSIPERMIGPYGDAMKMWMEH